MGDAAFLRTYGREERFRELLETKFEAIDAEAVFEVLKEYFDGEEYRIVNLKVSVKTFHGRGADLFVETGETIPTLTDDRDYRDDQWSKDKTCRLRIWPTDDLWIGVQDTDIGERVADYRPHSLLEDIRNEEKDDHDRERGPTSVPSVHARSVDPEFRATVLSRHDRTCPISGVDHPGLLDVAHVLSWRDYPEHRANPSNVLALSKTHHAAFDRELFTID